MKVVPFIRLPPAAASNERLPLSLPFSPSDLMMRYGPTGQWLTELHLPSNLASDPRVWSREDVAYFLRWCETEFDLPNFDMDLFQMNGKALCFLTKSDLNERSSGSGGLLHNILQLMIRETGSAQRYMPTSPMTPTSRGTRYPFPSLPYSNWYLSELYNAHSAAMLNSATLSPAPSTDSTSRSPDHSSTDNQASSGFGSGGSTGSHHSDSEEDPFVESSPTAVPPAPPASPPGGEPPPRTPSQSAPAHTQPQHFFPPDLLPEPNTNGRLLWDFLQQLLNDPAQRFTNFIAWKNHETGVFKIVDPSGLARLWGIQKNHLSMNYDKMSRALRYYYRVNILRKVQGERHCYQFLRNPSELKSIKNISLLRQQIALQKQQTAYNAASAKPDPDANEPTDLSTVQQQLAYGSVKPDPGASEWTELKSRSLLPKPASLQKQQMQQGAFDASPAGSEPTDLSTAQQQLAYGGVKPDPSASEWTDLKNRSLLRQPISLQKQKMQQMVFKTEPAGNEPTDLSTTRSSDETDHTMFVRSSDVSSERDRCETMHVSIVKSD